MSLASLLEEGLATEARKGAPRSQKKGMTRDEAHEYLLSKGYKPEGGSSRYINKKNPEGKQVGRIVGMMGPGDDWYVEIEGDLGQEGKRVYSATESLDDAIALDEDISLDFLLEATNGKVSTFLLVFSSILTQYDQLLSRNEMKRGYPGGGNIYRLGHYFEALERVRANVQGVINDDSKEAVAQLRAAVAKAFLPHDNPGKKLLKVVDAYLNGGKLPKIPISKETRAKIAAEKKAARVARATMKAKPVGSKTVPDMPMAAEAEHFDGIQLIEQEGGDFGFYTEDEPGPAQSKVEALEAAIEKAGGGIRLDVSALTTSAKALKKALSSKDDAKAKEELAGLLRSVEHAAWAVLGRGHAASRHLKQASDALSPKGESES